MQTNMEPKFNNDAPCSTIKNKSQNVLVMWQLCDFLNKGFVLAETSYFQNTLKPFQYYCFQRDVHTFQIEEEVKYKNVFNVLAFV